MQIYFKIILYGNGLAGYAGLVTFLLSVTLLIQRKKNAHCRNACASCIGDGR
jgi:hypothetical protein